MDYADRRLVFFFQAEDGIRDLTVTGVQTCALPIYCGAALPEFVIRAHGGQRRTRLDGTGTPEHKGVPEKIIRDRKSTRLNSSHSQISYAVFCLKKKKKNHNSSLPQVTYRPRGGHPR